ncbi:MAG: metallophosphoesterase family protein [Dehalococcoidia bacterium]|nr:metallophosphoesterase family protein [Dehalococcoidia bacterium]
MYHGCTIQALGEHLRALIVSDVHSNIEAFQSVIAHANDMEGFDQIWSLGDLVGYGPDPIACIDLLREYDHVAVGGNHDLAAVGKIGLQKFNMHAAAAARWTTTQLTSDHVDFLGQMPLRLEVHDFTLVHGSPRDPVWEYVITAAAAAASFSRFDTKRCLVGHSHIPFLCMPDGESAQFFDFPIDLPVRLRDAQLIINPGSVGQPRDGLPTASYALFDSDEQTITHYRAEYDIASTQERMTKHNLPQYLINRLARGR